MSQDVKQTAPVLFFSHSSKDVKLLNWFVKAARMGLDLDSKSVRFSSDAAYGFEPGKNIAELARDEVTEAAVFIAVVTPNSIKSDWFLAELALRFGAKNPLYLVVANGADFKDIPDPHKGIAAVKCTTTDLQSLFDTIADQFEPKKRYDYKTANEFLDEAEKFSTAMGIMRNDKPGDAIKGLETTAKASFISPKSDDLLHNSISYEVRCDTLPDEGNLLWICVEIEKEIWPKGPIIFSQAGDSVKSSFKEDGKSNYFFLEIVEVNQEGNDRMNKWLADGKEHNDYPGIDNLKGGLVASTRILRD